MARHAATVEIQIARRPRGGPMCETCAHLTEQQAGRKWETVCTKGHDLDPHACGEFRDISVMRPVLYGGITGMTEGEQ